MLLLARALVVVLLVVVVPAVVPAVMLLVGTKGSWSVTPPPLPSPWRAGCALPGIHSSPAFWRAPRGPPFLARGYFDYAG